jgi:hypothetical protein
MVLRRIGPLSAAKLASALYALAGIILGCAFALISLIGSGMAAAQREEGAIFGALFGVGAIVFLPLFYGALGFVGTLIAAGLYNWLAGLIGGVELDLEPGAPRGA